MGQVVADRVKDTTTTTGTGTVTLTGTAPTGFQAFATALAVGDTCFYCIAGGADWEVGVGTLATSTTLSRDQVTASSNSAALVNLAAGSHDVFLVIPAAEMQTQGAALAVALTRYVN